MAYDYESEVEARVCEYALKELGVFNIKLKKTQERGYPDRLFWIPGGRPLLIEFKRQGAQPTEYQQMIHKRLRYAGYEVQVHDDVEEAKRALHRAMGRVK